MSDRIEHELDARLREIARDIARETPGPSEDLMARILADAADVTAEQQAPVQKPAARVPRWRMWLAVSLPLRSAAAAAVLAVGLFAGLGIGYGLGGSATALEAFAGDLVLADFGETFLDVEEPI
ncbi:MAG: hypothetical protein AAGH74_08420 [Pseudomonadota bacterium]